MKFIAKLSDGDRVHPAFERVDSECLDSRNVRPQGTQETPGSWVSVPYSLVWKNAGWSARTPVHVLKFRGTLPV